MVGHVQLQICNTNKFMHALATDHPSKKLKPIQKCIKTKNNLVQYSSLVNGDTRQKEEEGKTVRLVGSVKYPP